MLLVLVQILGGLCGLACAYAMHRFVERKYERSTAEARVKYLAEMEEIRKAKLAAIKRREKLGAK
jgi:hypothetical protein